MLASTVEASKIPAIERSVKFGDLSLGARLTGSAPYVAAGIGIDVNVVMVLTPPAPVIIDV